MSACSPLWKEPHGFCAPGAEHEGADSGISLRPARTSEIAGLYHHCALRRTRNLLRDSSQFPGKRVEDEFEDSGRVTVKPEIIDQSRLQPTQRPARLV